MRNSLCLKVPGKPLVPYCKDSLIILQWWSKSFSKKKNQHKEASLVFCTWILQYNVDDNINESLFCIDFRAISMGQGQEVHARKLISQFMHTVSSIKHSVCHRCRNKVRKIESSHHLSIHPSPIHSTSHTFDLARNSEVSSATDMLISVPQQTDAAIFGLVL